MFFFIFCSFGANNNNIQLQARIILHASTILNAYTIHQARDDATSPTHTINGTRHPTSTVWRHSPRDGWRRGVARRDSRQNARAEQGSKSASHHCLFRKEAANAYPPPLQREAQGGGERKKRAARSGADVLMVAVREKRSREDGVCVEKAHVAVAVSGKPARDQSC